MRSTHPFFPKEHIASFSFLFSKVLYHHLLLLLDLSLSSLSLSPFFFFWFPFFLFLFSLSYVHHLLSLPIENVSLALSPHLQSHIFRPFFLSSSSSREEEISSFISPLLLGEERQQQCSSSRLLFLFSRAPLSILSFLSFFLERFLFVCCLSYLVSSSPRKDTSIYTGKRRSEKEQLKKKEEVEEALLKRRRGLVFSSFVEMKKKKVTLLPPLLPSLLLKLLAIASSSSVFSPFFILFPFVSCVSLSPLSSSSSSPSSSLLHHERDRVTSPPPHLSSSSSDHDLSDGGISSLNNARRRKDHGGHEAEEESPSFSSSSFSLDSRESLSSSSFPSSSFEEEDGKEEEESLVDVLQREKKKEQQQKKKKKTLGGKNDRGGEKEDYAEKHVKSKKARQSDLYEREGRRKRRREESFFLKEPFSSSFSFSSSFPLIEEHLHGEEIHAPKSDHRLRHFIRLENGMRFLFLLDPLQLPSAPSYISLSLQGGFLHDPPHMPGLATLAGHMIFNNPVPVNSPPISRAQRSSTQKGQGEEEKQRKEKKGKEREEEKEEKEKEREEEKRKKKEEEGENRDADNKVVYGENEKWSSEERKEKDERKEDSHRDNEGVEKEERGKREQEDKEEEDEEVVKKEKEEEEEEEEEFLYYPSLDSFLFANDAAEPLQFSTGEFISSLSYSVPSSVLHKSLDQLHYVLMNPNITEVAVSVGVIQLLQLQQRQVRTRRLEPYWRKTSILKNHVLNPAHRASRFHVGSTDLFFLLLHHQQSQRRQKAAQRQEASSPAKEREEQGRQEAFQEDQSDGKSSPDSHSSPRQALQNKHSSSGSRPSSSSSSVTRPRVSTDTYPNRPPSNGVTMRISVTSDGEDEESEEEEEEEEYEEEEEKSEEEESSFSSSSTSSSSLFFPLDQDSPMTSVRHSSSVASSSSPPSSYIKTSDLFTLAEDEEDEGDEAEEEEEEGETSQEKERRRKKRRKRRKKRRRRRKMFEPVKLPFPQQQMSVWILNESITSLVKKWYRHFYSPNAWTLVISAPGDVHTLERLVKKVYELFHKMKRNRALDEPFQCGGYKNTPYFNSPEEAELDEKENLELISKSQKGQRVSPSSSARGGGGERRRMGGGEENRQKKKRKGSEVVSEEDDGIEKERREVDSRDDEKEEGEVREREKKEGEDNKRKRGEEEDEEENEDSLRNLFQPRPIPHVACPLVGRSERMNDVSKKEKTEEKKKKEDSTVALEDLSEEKENEGAFFTHESTCKLKGDREETKIDDDRTGRKSASCELMQGGFVTLSPSSLAGVRREDELTKAEEKRRMKEEGGDEEEEEPERKKRKNKEEKEEDKKKEKEKKFVNSRDVPIARACDLKREVLLEPVSSEEHSVDFFFLFEKPHSQWSLHDAKFVVDVLGSEGEGSFLSILREQGLATSIDVEAEENHCYSLLRLTLELQPFNVNHTAITLIGSSLFSYLRFLRYTRLDEAFLDHRQRLYRIAFDAHLPPLPSRPGIPSIAGFVPSLFSSSSSSFSSSSSSSQSKSTNASPMKAGDSSPSPGLSAGGGGGGVGGLAVLGRETVSLSSTPGRMGIRMSPQEEVAFLAADLQELNHPQGIFSDQWVLDETTSSALNAYLDHISPDNLILMITSPVVLPLCTYSSSFFGLAFALNPLDPIQETTWKRIHSLSPEKSLLLSQHAGFSLPPVFYFLPSSSSSSSFSSTSSAEESRDPMSFPSSSELERIGGGGQQKVHLPRDYNEYGKRRRSEGSVQRRKKEEKEKEEEISHRTPSSFLVEKDRDKGRRKTPVSLSFSSHQPHLTSRQTSSEEREKGKEEEEDGEREEEKEEEKEEKDLFFSLREIPKYVEFSNPASRCYEHCELFHLPHRNEEDSPPRASISLLLNYSIPSPRDILRYEKDMLKKKSVKKRKKSNKKEKAGQKKGATSSSSSSSDLGKDSRNKKHTENDDNEEKKKKKNEEKDDRKEGEKEIAEEEQERKGEANVKGRGGEGEKLSTEGRERMKEPNTEKKFSSEMMAQVSIADQKGRAFSTGGVSSREEEEEEERRKQRDEEEEEEEDDEQEGEKKEKNSRGTYEVTEEEEPLLSAAEYREKICGLMNLYVSTVQEMIHEIVVYSSMTEVSFSISADPYAPRVEIHIDGLSSMLPLVLDVLIRGLVAGSPNAPENIPSSSSFSDIFVETSAPFSSPRKMRQAEPSSLERDPGDITSASSETDEILTEEEFIALFASSEDHPPLPTSFACTPEESAQRRNKKKAKELGGEDRGKVAARCNRYLDLSAFDQIKAERLGELRQRRRDPHSNIPNCLIELATDVLLRERRQRYWSRNGGSRRERLIDLVEHARLEDVENVGAMLKETVFIQALVMGDMNEKTAKRLLNRVASHLDVRRLPSAQELYDDPTISMKRMHPAPPFLEKQIWRRGSGKALPAIPRYRLRLHYDEVAEGGEFSSSYAHRLCGLGPSSLIGKSRASSMTTGGGQGQGGNSSTSSGSSGADSRKKDSSHPSHASKHRINNEKYELEEVDTHEDQGDSPSSKNRPSHRSKTSSSHHHSSSSNGGYQQISEAEKKTSYERQQQSRNGGGSGENVNLNQRQSLQSSSHRSHGGIGENSRSEASTKGRNLSGNSASTKASSSSSSPGQEKGATSSSLQTTAIRIELGELNDDELAAAVVLEVMLAYPLYRHLCALEEICHTLSFSFQHEPTGLSSFLLELHAYNLPACVVTERAEAWIFAQAGIFARLQDVADLLFFPYFEGGGTGGGGGNLSPSPPSYEPSSYSNFSSSAHFAYGSTPSELEAISSLPDGETVLLRRDFFKTSYSHPHPGTNFVILDGKHATAGGRGRREKGEEKKKKSSSRQTEGGGEEAQHKVHKNTGRGKGEGGNIAVKKGGDNGKGGARLQQEGLQKTTRNQEGPGREKSFVKKNEEGEEDEGFSCRPKKKKMSPKSLDAQEGRRGGRRKGGDEGTLWGYLASVRETLWSLVSGSGNSDEEEDDEDDEPSSVMGQGEKKRFCSRLPESQANRSRNAEDQDFRRKEDLKRPAGEREDDEDEDDDEEEVEREGEGYGERRREREDDEDEGKGEEIGGGGGGWGLVDGMSMLGAFDPRRFRAFADSGFFVLVNIERFHEAREKAVRNLLMLYPWEAEHYLHRFFHTTSSIPGDTSSSSSLSSFPSSSPSKKKRENSPSREDKAKEEMKRKDSMKTEKRSVVGDVEEDQEGEGQGDGHSGRAQGDQHKMKNDKRQEKEEETTMNKNHPRFYDRPFIPADVWVFVNEIRNRSYQFDTRERIARKIRSLTLENVKDFFLNYIVTSPWLVIELSTGFPVTRKRGAERGDAETPEVSGTSPFYYREYKTRGSESHNKESGGRGRRQPTKDTGAILLEDGLMLSSPDDTCNFTQRFYHERGSLDMTKLDTSESSHPLWRLRNSWSDIESIQEFRKAATRVYSLGSPHLYSSLLEKEQDHSSKKKNKQ